MFDTYRAVQAFHNPLTRRLSVWLDKYASMEVSGLWTGVECLVTGCQQKTGGGLVVGIPFCYDILYSKSQKCFYEQFPSQEREKE